HSLYNSLQFEHIIPFIRCRGKDKTFYYQLSIVLFIIYDIGQERAGHGIAVYFPNALNPYRLSPRDLIGEYIGGKGFFCHHIGDFSRDIRSWDVLFAYGVAHSYNILYEGGIIFKKIAGNIVCNYVHGPFLDLPIDPHKIIFLFPYFIDRWEGEACA